MSYAMDKDTPDLREGCLALAAPRYEVVPIRGVEERARALPHGATVTVTCSPRHGIDRTLETAAALAAAGLHPVPHIAARMVRDQAHLHSILERMAATGLREMFVVGGDAPEPVGAFAGGWELLEAVAGAALRPERIGVPAYPEGHPVLDAAHLQRALEAKAAIADYAVTQMCFESRPVLDWLVRQRALGFRLPVYIGLPGAMERWRLLTVAARLGLGASTRALRRQSGMLGRLMRSSVYRPDELVWELAPAVGDPELGIAGFHLYTFNQTEACRDWLTGLLTDLCQWHGISLDHAAATPLAENNAAENNA